MEEASAPEADEDEDAREDSCDAATAKSDETDAARALERDDDA
jgi:hypothetical protein